MQIQFLQVVFELLLALNALKARVTWMASKHSFLRIASHENPRTLVINRCSLACLWWFCPDGRIDSPNSSGGNLYTCWQPAPKFVSLTLNVVTPYLPQAPALLVLSWSDARVTDGWSLWVQGRHEHENWNEIRFMCNNGLTFCQHLRLSLWDQGVGEYCCHLLPMTQIWIISLQHVSLRQCTLVSGKKNLCWRINCSYSSLLKFGI